jgi:hypothetical protein
MLKSKRCHASSTVITDLAMVAILVLDAVLLLCAALRSPLFPSLLDLEVSVAPLVPKVLLVLLAQQVPWV